MSVVREDRGGGLDRNGAWIRWEWWMTVLREVLLQLLHFFLQHCIVRNAETGVTLTHHCTLDGLVQLPEKVGHSRTSKSRERVLPFVS